MGNNLAHLLIISIELAKMYAHLQVAEEIWICENGTVTKWQGGILKYKDHLKSKILKENAENATNTRK